MVCLEIYTKSVDYSTSRPFSHLSLPQVFRKMLNLPEPTLTFKGEDCMDFLKENENNLYLLPDFLENPIDHP
jgi:hypothetical protein